MFIIRGDLGEATMGTDSYYSRAFLKLLSLSLREETKEESVASGTYGRSAGGSRLRLRKSTWEGNLFLPPSCAVAHSSHEEMWKAVLKGLITFVQSIPNVKKEEGYPN